MKFQATLQLKKALKGVPKKLNIINMKFRIWKIWHKLEWVNKQVNVFNRCYFWNFVSGHQFLTLLEIILWVTFLFRSLILTLFRMGIFGGAHGWGGGRPHLPKICHTYRTMMKLGSCTLPKEDPKNIWITWHTLEFCWYQHFFTGNQQIFLYQEIQI